MSELKAYKGDVTIPVYGTIADAEVYLKSEADKVIAEKDAEIVELKKQVHDYALGLFVMQAKTEKEACHQKFKRCLAMVKYCHESAMWLEEYGVTKYAMFMLRWQKRWLELAEKFKEVK